MRIGSLFTGVAGLDMAVQGVFGGTHAWFSEIDKAASKVLAYRFPGVRNLGDITQIDWAAVEPVDVLCGGFPCQDVSAAGKRAGIKDGTRSGLWAVFAEAIDALQPQYVVIENVRGLLSAAAHRTVEDDAGDYLEPDPAGVGNGSGRPVLRAAGAVLGDLADLGYDAQWATVAAADVGAPHRRERVFIVGVAGDSSGASGRANCSAQAEWGIQRELFGAAAAKHGAESRFGGSNGDVSNLWQIAHLLPTPVSRDGKDTHSSQRMAEKSKLTGIAHLLPTPEAKNSHAGPDYARMNREGSGGHDLVTAVAYHNVSESAWGKYEPAIRRWEQVTGQPAPAPTEPNKNGNPRLSAAFSEWLMGWPAGWVTDPAIGISRSDQLRCVGNGVVTLQAVAALRYLLGVAAASEVAANG